MINDSNKNLTIKANNDTILEIPAKTTIKKLIILPTVQYEVRQGYGLGIREVIDAKDINILANGGNKIYRLSAYSGKTGNDIKTNITLVAPNYRDVAEWSHKPTNDNNKYDIELHFVEDANGTIKPASKKLEVETR